MIHQILICGHGSRNGCSTNDITKIFKLRAYFNLILTSQAGNASGWNAGENPFPLSLGIIFPLACFL